MAHRILKNTRLNENVCRLSIAAREIAAKALPGQFIIARIDERGERIPLTVFRADAADGTIEIIVQEAGTSTIRLCRLSEKDEIRDIIGPLGRAAEIKKYGRVICVGGGVGIAELYPVTKALYNAGNEITAIIGARRESLLILEEDMRRVSHALHVTTDDGSRGRRGFVSDVLRDLLGKDRFDIVFAVGPIPMMQSAAQTTRPHGVKTIVSLNSIMVDGTGMCGSCRVTVAGKVRFVCVDGPDFDAHEVDFAQLSLRQSRFAGLEKISLQNLSGEHGPCRLNQK